MFTVTKWEIIESRARIVVLQLISFMFAHSRESVRIEGVGVGVVLFVTVHWIRGRQDKGSFGNDRPIDHVNVFPGNTGEGCYTQCGVSVGSVERGYDRNVQMLIPSNLWDSLMRLSSFRISPSAGTDQPWSAMIDSTSSRSDARSSEDSAMRYIMCVML